MKRWREVEGFPMYRVSDAGDVYSLYSGKLLKPRADRDGYLEVNLFRDRRAHMRKIHRLVLVAFAGPCPRGYESRHGDSNPSNNNITNLSWGTLSINRRDAVRRGTHYCHARDGGRA